jgi:hypothetical protein
MSRKNKRIEHFLKMPADFQYSEAVKLLGIYGFEEINKGKTSGSRVRFQNKDGIPIMLHKPHPSGIMKRYQLRQIKEILEL